MLRNDIELELQTMLLNQKLQYIYRSCDLIDIGFGDLFRRINLHGKETFPATFALHLQCPFRVTSSAGIIMSSNELRIPIEENIVVDLSKSNSCLLDVKCKELLNMYPDEYVTDVRVSKYGDVEISLTNICICTFVDSLDNESWRFFRVGTQDMHYVMYGTGMCLE